MRGRKPHAMLAAVMVAFVLISGQPAHAKTSLVPSPTLAAILRVKQVMVGYGGGEMRWENTVTRAEAVKILLAAIGEVAPSLNRAPMAFVDVDSSHWAYGHITMAAELGMVRGRPGNVFDPEQGVTMAEFAVMVTRVYAGLGASAGPAGSKISVKPAWAAPEIVGWKDLVQLLGEGSEVLNLDYPASRGEVGTLTGLLMERLGLAYDVLGTVAGYRADEQVLTLDLPESVSAVKVPAAPDGLWYLEDKVVLPSALVGRKVGVVLDSAGKAALVHGGVE
jgi:hypothetical protein